LGSSFTKVTALVAFGFISIFSIIFLVIGIVLNSLTRLRLDLLRLEYLHQGRSSWWPNDQPKNYTADPKND
jgi:hypothetical protein